MLYSLLDQVDGFLFTGGNLTLVDRESGEVHAYYRTAKKVIEYAKKRKDERGIDFPILAICQGFELLGIYVNDDSKDVLKDVECVAKQRKTEWQKPLDEVRATWRLFRDFDQDIIEKMAEEPSVIHFHKWGFPLTDYLESKGFTEFFNLISINTLDNGVQFPTAFEAQRYPIYCVLYHPEYNMVLNKSDKTLRIANSFSKILSSQG